MNRPGDEDGGVREKRNTRRAWAAVIAVATVLVVGAGVSGLVYLLTGGAKGVTVPDVVGESYESARTVLGEEGLGIEVDSLQDSASREIEGLEVLSQSPRPESETDEGDTVVVRLEGLPEVEPASEFPWSGENVEIHPETATAQERDSAAEPRDAQAATEDQGIPGGTVCIDPGHSVDSPSSEIDPATGLDVADNSGAAGELEAMWQLALKVKANLERMGYTVRLTKPSADSYASLRTRADIGNTCAIVVRLHYDPDLQALLYPGEGQYKEHNGHRVTVDPAVARSSEVLASTMLPYLRNVGVDGMRNDMGGTSKNSGPAFVGSVLSRVPVVLIENDPAMVRNNPGGQEQVAAAVAQGVDEYMRTR